MRDLKLSNIGTRVFELSAKKRRTDVDLHATCGGVDLDGGGIDPAEEVGLPACERIHSFMSDVKALCSVVDGEHVDSVVDAARGGPGELPACAALCGAPAGDDSSASDVREGGQCAEHFVGRVHPGRPVRAGDAHDLTLLVIVSLVIGNGDDLLADDGRGEEGERCEDGSELHSKGW